jgi:flagellar biosynthesis/type III secretory pathway M-ring protein FliF/YscJ
LLLTYIFSIQLQIGQPQPPPSTDQPGTGVTGLSDWVYAVIAIAVVGLILVLLIIIVILAVRRREKPRR